MPGGWGPGAWTPSGGQEPFTGGSYSSGSGSGSENGNGDGNGGGLDLNWFDDQDEQLQADIAALEATTHPYGGLTLAEELADIAATDPKYDLSWEGQQGYSPNTLGQFIATDWQGNPILDSSGNVIWSGLGEYAQENYGDIRPDISGTSALQNLQGLEQQYYSQKAEQEQRNRMMNQEQTAGYGYGYDPGGGRPGGGGYAYGVKGFHRGRPENISPWARNIAGTPMLPVAGSGAGASMASADELYALASGKKAFSMTPEEQGILALLNA